MKPNNNTTKYLNFFTATFFILNIFVNLVEFENNLHGPTDYTHYSNQTEIELVVSERAEYNLSLDKLNLTQKQVADFSSDVIDFSAIHKHWLIYFQNFVRIQLKSFNYNFIPKKQIVSILQNMWHHSSISVS